MGNMLFKDNLPRRQKQGNSLLDSLRQIQSQGPSGLLFNRMYSSNPQFRQFADSMQGKTPEQAFRENGFDFEQFRGFKW